MADQGVDIDLLLERIQGRLDVLGISERKASLIATGRPDAIRYIRTRRSVPSMGRMMKIAAALETTSSYLVGLSEVSDADQSVSQIVRTFTDTAVDNLVSLVESDAEDALPIWEVSPREYMLFDTASNDKKAVNLYQFGPSIVEIVERPGRLKDTHALGFRMPDSSMYPAYEAGTLIFVERNVKIALKDDVVIGVTTEDDQPSGRFLLGRVMARRTDYIEIRQFGAGASFNVPINRIEVVYRALRVTDFVGKRESAALVPHNG